MNPNDKRRARALDTVRDYAQRACCDDDIDPDNPNMSDCLSDLLADLMHLCGLQAVEDAFRLGALHYESERQ